MTPARSYIDRHNQTVGNLILLAFKDKARLDIILFTKFCLV